jgi:hypothetical protein
MDLSWKGEKKVWKPENVKMWKSEILKIGRSENR